MLARHFLSSIANIVFVFFVKKTLISAQNCKLQKKYLLNFKN